MTSEAEYSEWIYSSDELPKNRELMATVSNGFLGTRIFDESIYAAGVFNGDHLNSHRAIIPSTIPVQISFKNIPESNLKRCYTLNAKNGCFMQTIKWQGHFQVEQKVYAHRSYRNLIITELKAKTTQDKGLKIVLKSQSGKQSNDFDFQHKIMKGK